MTIRQTALSVVEGDARPASVLTVRVIAGLSWVNSPAIASRLLASERADLSGALLGRRLTGIVATGLGGTHRAEESRAEGKKKVINKGEC